MNTTENSLYFIKKTVGIVSIIAGLFIMLVFFLMQGAPLFILGIPFIFFGIAVLLNKIYIVLILLNTLIAILFSLFIMMSVIDKSIPRYAQIPLEIGLAIVAPFWFVVVGGSYLWKKNKK